MMSARIGNGSRPLNFFNARAAAGLGWRRLFPSLIVLALAGCSGMPGAPGGGADLPPVPRWGAGAPEGMGAPGGEPTGRPVYEGDGERLHAQVLARCTTARVAAEQGFLAPLVADLRFSGIAPGDAADVLILGDCGSLSEVVSELVAQGGRDVVPEVSRHARMLAGPGAEGIVDAAVGQGLERHAAGDSRPLPGGMAGAGGYGMAYFPSRAAAAGIESAGSASALYNRARPGFGLYTFVVPGGGPGDRTNLLELLRVIGTYVLGEDGDAGPKKETHVFLLAVDPGRSGRTLDEQLSEAVSAPMRRDLGLYLVYIGESDLAKRLSERPGPFLISGLEPSLMPVEPGSPRLVVDLSEVGGEHMYAVVDAYDRPVPANAMDRGSLLDAVRSRLLSLVHRGENGARPQDRWVFLVKEPEPGAGGASPDSFGPDDRGGEPATPDPDPEYQRPRLREAGSARNLSERA